MSLDPTNWPAVCLKKTFDNWECAKDKAQRRKQDAVLDIAPKTNSIVSIS